MINPICPHCARANAADARFCYFDGVSLLGKAHVAADAAVLTFPTPMRFPSGTACKNFDEFARCCLEHWDEAVGLLQNGVIHTFFRNLGRMDVMLAAQEAAAFPDRDRGLDLFLERLPTRCLPPAKLAIQPRSFDLGKLKVGAGGCLQLHLENKGRRPIFGSIASDCNWLSVSESGDARLFQFRQTSSLAVHIKGQFLRAGLKPLEGSLLVDTNAGTFQIRVIAQVPIVPYPTGVLAGALTPRDVAEIAKRSGKYAAPEFESGALARWYRSNGWIYPVQGPAANGVAAVQQFFEALGLSKPPTVRINAQKISLKAKSGARLTHSIHLRGEENRPVYAHGTSSAAWLVVKPALSLGASADLPLEIVVPENARGIMQTTLRVQSNGQQQFDIPVELAIEEAVSVATAVAADTSLETRPPPGRSNKSSALNTAVPPQTQNPVVPSRRARLLRHALPICVLGLVLAGLVAKDSFSGNSRTPQVAVKEEPPEHAALPNTPRFQVAVLDEPDEVPLIGPVARFKIENEPEEQFMTLPLPPVKVEIKDEPGENNRSESAAPIATAPLVRYRSVSPPRRFGISTTAAAGAARLKRLTYADDGDTNSTVVSVDGRKTEFGGRQGQWTRLNQPLRGIEPTPGAVQPSQSTWTWNTVAFHQILEVIPGQPVTVDGGARRQLDAVLIRWMIQNTGATARRAGMRLQLDTLIGENDGVPFTVPGSTSLVNTRADFRSAGEVPDFIQALERPSLRNPGTVAHLTLKYAANVEPPSRVSLTGWPGFGALAWDLPVRDLGDDSAVVMYWPEKSLKPGEARIVGFAYGLGSVAATDKLGVTLGGSFEPGQKFTVSAYVENPLLGQSLRLELPEGLQRVEGAATQNVAAGNATARNTSVVTWKVLVERTGEFRLKVLSSTGLSQGKTISIAQGQHMGKLQLELHGSFEPGQIFTVLGKVSEPVDKQTLTLHLPEGLQKVQGEGEGETVQPVPAPPAGSKDAVVHWKVRVLEPGKFPVRVSSSTGVTQTKTVTIVRPGRAEGMFQIALQGDFAPGKTFTVSTKVVNPAPDQELTLVLPSGLQCVEGALTQTALPEKLLAWKVKIQQTGKFLVGVKSTTGFTQRKTVSIDPPNSPSDLAGRFTFDLEGDIPGLRPGKEFRVKAEVAQPLERQTLTLVLPKGLELVSGKLAQDVGQPPSGTAATTVTWNVRVIQSGQLPVRIESSSGLARAKTIQLSDSSSTLFGR